MISFVESKQHVHGVKQEVSFVDVQLYDWTKSMLFCYDDPLVHCVVLGVFVWSVVLLIQ